MSKMTKEIALSMLKSVQDKNSEDIIQERLSKIENFIKEREDFEYMDLMNFINNNYSGKLGGYYMYLNKALDQYKRLLREYRVSNKKKCIAGCRAYEGGERYHHSDCPFYPESMSYMFDKLNLGNFDELSRKFGVEIELRFGRNARAIVGNKIIPIHQHLYLFDEVEKTAKLITEEGQRVLKELDERLKTLDPNIFPDNLFDEEK